MHDIIPLLQYKYDGYEFSMDYTSEVYYDVRIHDTRQGFSVDFVRMPFPSVQHKKLTGTLYEKHWELPEPYGIFDEGKLVSVLEVSPERWNNRLRVTHIWVHPDYRRQGLGVEMIEKAKRLAAARGFRAVVLETQSSNAGAITFYFSQGFVLAGLDAYAYSNEDIERKEVRVEMVYRMPKAAE